MKIEYEVGDKINIEYMPPGRTIDDCLCYIKIGEIIRLYNAGYFVESIFPNGEKETRYYNDMHLSPYLEKKENSIKLLREQLKEAKEVIDSIIDVIEGRRTT